MVSKNPYVSPLGNYPWTPSEMLSAISKKKSGFPKISLKILPKTPPEILPKFLSENLTEISLQIFLQIPSL